MGLMDILVEIVAKWARIEGSDVVKE